MEDSDLQSEHYEEWRTELFRVSIAGVEDSALRVSIVGGGGLSSLE